MIKLLELFFVFFTIGLFTIGGGYAMIPMIEDQVVSRGWLQMDELLNFFSIAESTPGPFAVNTATLVGFNQAGIIGAIVSTLAVISPSFIIIVLIAKFISKFVKNEKVEAIFNGIKPIIFGLLITVVIGLVHHVVLMDQFVFAKVDFTAAIIMIIIFILKITYKKLNPILLILISGVLGLVFYGVGPLLFSLIF